MSNYTFEDYKKAIKAKYEEEKNGEYSNNLNSPTSANLRNLCIKRFETNNSKDDLITFKSFFDFPFDRDNRNLYGEIELNKLTAVRRFLLNVTESPAEDTVQLAAILVDLQPRPFKEFQKQLDPEEVKLIKELRGTKIPENEISSNTLIDEVEIENFPDFKNEEVAQDDNQDWEAIPMGVSDTSIPVKTGKGDVEKSKINRYFIILAFFSVLIVAIYLRMSQKDCMQWTGDHYEKIERSEEGFCDTYYDARYFDLKKIEVCDKTEFFDNNGKAKVFYIKVGNSVECYNQIAPYPENTQRFLKPITQYIIDKYLSNRPKCK